MAELISVIGGILQFWSSVVWFVKTLQKTPEEQHQDLLANIQKEVDSFNATGRPSSS